MNEPETTYPEPMLTLEEAAADLRYTRYGLYEIVQNTKKGKPGPQIQFFQVGSGPIKFKREWLDEFVLANSIAPGQIVVAKPSKPRRQSPGKSGRAKIESHWSLAV